MIVSRTNMLPNSVFNGPDAATATPWENITAGATVGDSSFFPGERALTVTATAARVRPYFNFTAGAFLLDHTYRFSLFVEYAAGALLDSIGQFRGPSTAGGDDGRGWLFVRAGHVGVISVDFTISLVTGTPQIFIGIGLNGNDTGTIRVSRPMVEDITGKPKTLYQYIPTSFAGAVTKTIKTNTYNINDITRFGDSLTQQQSGYYSGYVTAQTFLGGLLPSHRVRGIGIPGYTSTQILGLMTARPDRMGDIFVIWAGRNDLTTAGTAQEKLDGFIANINAMAALSSSGKFLFLTVTGGAIDDAPTKAVMASLNSFLLTNYPDNTIDINAYLLTQGTGAGQDAIDVAAGIVPASLRTDNIHLTVSAYHKTCCQVKLWLEAKGWAESSSVKSDGSSNGVFNHVFG